jgi:hypothetical protein
MSRVDQSPTPELQSVSKLELLNRALDAEDRADELERRNADLELRIKAALNADPTTAVRALSWIGRAEEGEAMLCEILHYVNGGELRGTALPPGWVARAEAQIAAVRLMRRDLMELTEKPSESWADYVESHSGRRSVIRE